MNVEQPGSTNTFGLSAKEKKAQRLLVRKEQALQAKRKIINKETYGETKISRRIPREVAGFVAQRDTCRDFGRPGHLCPKPGAPHHIIHFEKFLYHEIEGNPHSAENLECPCSECHKLAHEMHIPSGISVETFFRNKFNNKKHISTQDFQSLS